MSMKSTTDLHWADFISIRPGVISEKECKEIIDFFNAKDQWEDSRIYDIDGNRKLEENTRKGKICWDKEHQCPHLWKLKNQIIDYNKSHQMNLSGAMDVQAAMYPVGAHFKRHQDTHVDLDHYKSSNMRSHRTRKISATIQLSNSSDYEGGELHMTTDYNSKGSTGIQAPKDIGTMVLFPSWLKHQVNPVTKGLRYALVLWAEGPFWK